MNELVHRYPVLKNLRILRSPYSALCVVGFISWGILLGMTTYYLPHWKSENINIPTPHISENVPPQSVEAPTSTIIPVGLRVQKGDTLVDMLRELGISRTEAHEASQSIQEVFNVKDLQIGNEFAVAYEQNHSDGTVQLASLTIDIPDRQIELLRDDGGRFISRKVMKESERKLERASGSIESSLFVAAQEMGVPVNIMMQAIKVLSYDVDFQRDIQPGDSYEVLFDKHVDKNGKKIKDGELIYIALNVKGRTIKLYRYVTAEGIVDYLTPEGKSVRKALLKTPIDGARISSGFGMRKHPILGYSKMHKGVDFAAPTGTPIYAAGDGKIEYAGWMNGYGNYVRIKHNSEYSTAYAHISRFAKSAKIGKAVRQGEVIAYVGSTGNSTGPHLHYEVLNRTKQINPVKVKMTPTKQLGATELAKFKIEKDSIENTLASLSSKPQLASN